MRHSFHYFTVIRKRLFFILYPQKVVLMLLLVVILFVCLWGPVLLYNVLLRFGLGSHNPWTTWCLSMTFHLMAYFNSCINPVVYFFVSKNFRDSFLTVMCCRTDSDSNKQIKFGVRSNWDVLWKLKLRIIQRNFATGLFNRDNPCFR